MPEPSAFHVEMAIGNISKVKKIKRNDQIPAEVIKVVGRTFRSEIRKHSTCIWNKEELPEEWKESIRRVIK